MINESKLKEGKLTLGGAAGVGGVEFACQATNVRVTPSHDESGDPVETLCGDTLSADVKTTWVLAGTSIQDFDAPDGFVQYSVENNLTTVEFTWQPNASTFTVEGEVQVRALEIGGDVNTRITADFEWPLQGGDPTFTWPVTVPLDTEATTDEPEPPAEPAAADDEPAPGPPTEPAADDEPEPGPEPGLDEEPSTDPDEDEPEPEFSADIDRY